MTDTPDPILPGPIPATCKECGRDLAAAEGDTLDDLLCPDCAEKHEVEDVGDLSTADEPDAEPVFLVFDTETSGLFDFKLPADDPSQPRLASLAAILVDATGQEIERWKYYIQPHGWSIDGTEAAEVNGLTDEFLRENGVPISHVLDIWAGWVDQGLYFIAHNAQFDAKMMRSELRRAHRDDLFEQTKQSCTMRSCAAHYGQLGMPVKRGTYVKLQEAVAYFGSVVQNPHDAMADAEGALFLLQRLLADDALIEPRVHYAKGRG